MKISKTRTKSSKHILQMHTVILITFLRNQNVKLDEEIEDTTSTITTNKMNVKCSQVRNPLQKEVSQNEVRQEPKKNKRKYHIWVMVLQKQGMFIVPLRANNMKLSLDLWKIRNMWANMWNSIEYSMLGRRATFLSSK